MIRASLIALALFAAGCAQPTQAPPAEPPSAAAPQSADEATAQDACGASRFTQLIGTMASEIDRASLPAGARIITPDSMVTQDFSAGRLNLFTGTDGRVSSLRCF